MRSLQSACRVLAFTAIVLISVPLITLAQDKKPSLAEQLRTLQTKVSKLETALKQKHEAASPTGSAMSKSGMKMGGKMGGKMSGMGKMSGKGMSGMSGKKMGGMGGGGMGMGGSKGMGVMGGKGMSMMGKMKGMGQMQMSSALPGFAGASHIYHVGATGFFLDHSEHITLTKEQQVKLNAIKEKTLLAQATSDRWIEQGEQELWVLTSSDTPKASEIEAKIREIEKITSDKRIAYIRAVGEAAKVLTKEQRQTLVGSLPAGHTAKSEGSEN